MRGVVVCLLAAGSALGSVLSATAAERPFAKAQALVAQSGDTRYGAVSSTRDGADTASTQVADDAVTVADGEAATRADSDGAGHAAARASDVSVLGGRVTARAVSRRADRAGGYLTRAGAVKELVVDGTPYGTLDEHRVIALDGGGKVVVNTAGIGLRVVTSGADVRVAVADVTAVGPAPTPVPSPSPTPTTAPTSTPTSAHTPKPTSTPHAKRRKAPDVKRHLTRHGYAFPIYSDQAEVADNFGAARAAPIVVHQGDDIFAPFGSPVVAVRDGRLDHVGTLPISGNRLWLHTANGDAFFYAHLSAFSEQARNGARVKAGTVLGFVGNTGDAEHTPPHLHFEVHPGGMNKPAVDPYPIVTAWQRRDDVPPGAWLQQLGPDATQRPGTLVTVRDFIAE